jgi:polysaccharide chain length determinant protein (PEP-CTERM system associated)
MHEVLVLLLRYARGVWRYRWWMLGIAWVVSLVGWTVVARMPDQYQATARVYVDTSSVLQPFLQGLAIRTTDIDRKISLMTRTLLSQPNLEKVMRMTDLDLKAKTAQDREDIIEELKSGIRFRSTSRDNLYTINYADHSPELAKLVVKSLLTIFMEGNLGEARKEQDTATQFLEQQIAEYERRMRESEARLVEFKQRNLNLLPNESGGYYQKLRDTKARVEAARLDLKVQEDRLQSLQEQVEGEVPTFGLNWLPEAEEVGISTPELDRRIGALEAKLDDLLVRYTERHPDVISTQAAIERLEQERREEIANARRALQESGASGANGMNSNPVYQQMRISLSQAEAEVAAKRSLLQEFESQLATLETSADEVATLEAQSRELQREYDVLKRNHGALESRLESARLGRKADASADTVQFRVIDPPRVPLKPSGPNRVLLSAMVLGAGLAIGFGVAFLMSQLRPTYDERQVLNDTLGLPVLGSVNMVWTTDQIRARKVRNLSFVATLTSLVVVFGVVLALYQFDIDLLPRLARALQRT